MMSYDYLFKIIIIGDTDVGKTNILSRFINEYFDPNTKQTIGVEFSTKILTIDDKNIKVQLWDTAGQERYRAIISSYYRGASGVIIVYDVTNRTSFMNIKNWYEELEHRSNYYHILLIGNKADLIEERQVSIEEGQKFASKYGLDFFETSASNGQNIDNIFTHLVNKILTSGDLQDSMHKKLPLIKHENTKQRLSDPNSHKKCNCQIQ